jgi:predicted amidohydrolase YtcJ
MRRFVALATLVVALPLGAQQKRPASKPADLLVTNARIYTADDTRPVVEAIAIRDGRVLFAGSKRGATVLAGPATRVLDMGGRTVIPGMTDAHAHLLGLGTALRTVDLTGTTSYAEVVARVAARAREVPAGTWIIGRGWDQNRWADARFPTHEALDAAVPDHPVALERIDGHATLANARAMRAACVTAETKVPTGGRIERVAGGAPSGVFVDNATGRIDRAVPAPTRDELRASVLAAVKEANRWGLTAIHDAGVTRPVIEIYEELARAGRFDLRDYVMVSDDSASLDYYFRRGPRSALYDGRVSVRAIKLYADGALGSRGAALLTPYSDDPHNVGLLVSSPEHLERQTERALRAGFQVATHAIGDRGNRNVLDAYAKALAAVPVADPRLRVEHAQVLSPEDIPRFADLGVIPSMQASHQTSDMGWAERRVGSERIRGAYAWRSLLRTGVVIPNGSDFPVERVNPLISFHSAVTRQDADNLPPGGWYPDQRMTRDEALKAMTIWPAYASFQDSVAGSLSPGKYADFVVLDQDIMEVPPERILATRVMATWLGGKPVYEIAETRSSR